MKLSLHGSVFLRFQYHYGAGFDDGQFYCEQYHGRGCGHCGRLCFDPRKKYEQIYANDDPGSNYGIRMIMAEAGEVRYTSIFNLNNLLIRIAK